MSHPLNTPALRFVLYHIRFLQILFALALGIIAFLFTKIPHNLWILFSVLAIISTFETGLEVSTSIKRAKGTIVGLILGVPIIYLCHLNYRLIPVGLLVCAGCMWLANFKNAHIIVIFFILLLFFTTSYLFSTPTFEGPFEFTVNRIVCESVGILICLGTDYVIFSKFNYSRKVYLLLQYEICKMFEEKLAMLLDNKKLQKNKYMFHYHMHESIDKLFFDLEKCQESLAHDLRTDQKTKDKMNEFSKLLFKLHNKIFAIYYCTLILHEAPETDGHIAEFQETLKEAKRYFIEDV